MLALVLISSSETGKIGSSQGEKPVEILVCGNPTIDELTQNSKAKLLPGGSVLYASAACTKLGTRVKILGNIGPDYPSNALRWLRSRGVNVSLLNKTDAPTTRFRIEYRKKERRLWLLAPGSKIRLNPGIEIKAAHLGPVFNEIDPGITRRIRRKCSFLSADLQGYLRIKEGDLSVRNARRNLSFLLQSCDMVKASLPEVETQLRTHDPYEGAERLLHQGPKQVIVTLGSKGSVLGIRARGIFLVPAFSEPEIIDPTGAGDVLIGSWLSVYFRTHDPVWAASVGSAVASLTSRKAGLSKFVFSRNELFRRSCWVYDHIEAIGSA